MTSYPSPTHGLDLRNYGPPRSSGIHLSAIIRHIALITGDLAKEYGTGPTLTDLINSTPTPDTGSTGPIVKASVGFAWESWLATRVHNLNHQPGELVCDGIHMSPDGIDRS